MVYVCCVPACRGNYAKDGLKVSVFRFPKDTDQQNRWINVIPRANYTVTNHSRVCELHFDESDIIREETFTDTNGDSVTVPFKYPKLRNTAIPRKFPGFPSYLSKKETKRDDLNEKKDPLEVKQINEAIKLSLRVKVEEDERFSISNYSDFKNCLFKECIPPVWNVIQKDSCTLFLNITLEVAPCIKCSVVVHENLNVNAFIGTSPVTSYINDDKFPFKINDFRDVLKVLKFTECMTEGKDINFDE